MDLHSLLALSGACSSARDHLKTNRESRSCDGRTTKSSMSRVSAVSQRYHSDVRKRHTRDGTTYRSKYAREYVYLMLLD